MKPFPGVASLPLAGCLGTSATQTYTIYSTDLSAVTLLFVLGTTPTAVTTSAPEHIKFDKWPASCGVIYFNLRAGLGLTLQGASGVGTADAPTAWLEWGGGGAPKVIQVTTTLNDITFSLAGVSQTFPYSTFGYSSGLFANLYFAGATTIDGSKAMMTASGAQGVVEATRGAAMTTPNWWWSALALLGVLTLLMILALAWGCKQ